MVPDNMNNYYNLLMKPLEEANDVEKAYWKWMMTYLMPIVSKDWSDRLKGKKSLKKNNATGEEEDEELGHYLSCSDFAYVPMVIRIYGEREMENVDEKRKKGRTKGQSGMMSKENIAQYVESVIRMKSVLDDIDNSSNLVEWGKEMFDYIETLDLEVASQATVNLAAISEAARKAAEQDIRRLKKDEILIPV
jgi:hypothetical protein